jgi:predicted XRE-type DNA-binding protein
MATPADRPLARTDVPTTSEVAELLGIPRSTVHGLARREITPLDDPALEAWKRRLKALERERRSRSR